MIKEHWFLDEVNAEYMKDVEEYQARKRTEGRQLEFVEVAENINFIECVRMKWETDVLLINLFSGKIQRKFLW